MKKKLLIVCLIVASLYGCFLLSTDQPYKFRQEYEQIAHIEILKKTQDVLGYDVPMEALKTLAITEYRAFIDGLMKVEGSRVGLDPPTGFGVYIIRITYQNGEIELISDFNNGYISVDGTVHEDVYCMDKEQFYDFLSGFLGEHIPEPAFN